MGSLGPEAPRGAEQTTIARPVARQGIGLHTGASSTLTLLPADPDAGIIFVSESGVEIPALADHVVATNRATTLGLGAGRVQSVEHLLSALYALGVDNVRAVVAGPEVPACDGSAREWVSLIRRAGRRGLGRPRPAGALPGPVWTGEGESWAMAWPAHRLLVAVGVHFPETAVGRQGLWLALTGRRYTEELAPARTFAFEWELESLRASGMARGGGAENAFAVGQTGYSGPLRFPDEVVRHKALDLIGDLALCGRRVKAQVVAVRPSHGGNVALARALRKALVGEAGLGCRQS